MLAGGYVKFAICEYYNDTIFTIFAQTILTSITMCDHTELRQYEKVNKRAHNLILLFFAEHLTVIFTKFEPDFIEKLLRVLLAAMNDPIFEV